MVTLHTLKKLSNNDGLTLKDGKAITYKTGWQVATEGKEATTPAAALKLINDYNGNCGIWFSNGIYYIDKSKRITTKKEALSIGRKCNQISIYGWKNGVLAYC